MNTVRLRHLVEVGPRPHRRLDPKIEVTFAPMEAIADGIGGLDASYARPLGEVSSGTYNFFEDGDILLAKVTPCFENGKKALASGLINGIGYATSEVHVIRPKNDVIYGRFLIYLFSSAQFRHEGIASMTGAGGLRRVSDHAILNHRLAVTDLEAQKSIAKFLDHETARIDGLIKKKNAFLQASQERWLSLLDETIFPGAPSFHLLPQDWIPTPLKYLTDVRRPIMYGIVLPGPDQVSGPLIVKGGDVKPGRLHPDKLCRTTDEIESRYVRSRLREGDLVISIRGGIGDIEIVPKCIEGANLTQDAARIAPKAGINNRWLRYALSAPSVFFPLEVGSMGAAVRGINIFDLKRVVVPTPPTHEQSAIADRLSKEEEELTRLQNLVVRHRELIVEHRSAMITAAVTGQIDTTQWRRRGVTDRALDRIEEAAQ